MRKLQAFFAGVLFVACGTKDVPVPDSDKQDGGLKIDVLGASATSNFSNGLSTLWSEGGEPSVTFLPDNHTGITLYGTHQLQSVGVRNLVYFGTEIIDSRSRIVLFTYEGKKILSEEVGLYLMPDRHENLYAYGRDPEGNLYLSTQCQTTGYRHMAYVYKISNLLDIEKVDMPNDISFAVFNTADGIIALRALMTGNSIALTIGHEDFTRWVPDFILPGYSDLGISGAYQDSEGKVLVLVKALHKESNTETHFMYRLDRLKKTFVRHVINIGGGKYTFGKGLMEGNILYLPASERNTNRTCYMRLDTQTDLEEIAVTKVDLETDPTYPTATATFIQRLDGGLFVGGTQFGKACYWHDGKLVVLPQADGVVRSYPTEIMTYRLAPL